MENFKGVSKQKRKKNIKRLSFIITQFKIEFLLLPVVGKCLCLKKCLIIKYKILHIQFSDTICSKKLDQNLVLYTIFTIYLGLLIRLRVPVIWVNTSLTTILMTVLILFAPAETSVNIKLFLHCHHYNAIQSISFKDLNSVDKNLFKLSDNELTFYSK